MTVVSGLIGQTQVVDLLSSNLQLSEVKKRFLGRFWSLK